jgi:hypothetical protein
MVVLSGIHNTPISHTGRATRQCRSGLAANSAAGPTPVRTTHGPARCVLARGTIPGSTNNYMNGFAPSTSTATVPDSAAHTRQQQKEGDSSNTISSGFATSGALAKADYAKFVHFFRSASPYIAGHRGRTFVIVVPGNVSHGHAAAPIRPL